MQKTPDLWHVLFGGLGGIGGGVGSLYTPQPG